jgi:hypothetical protein
LEIILKHIFSPTYVNSKMPMNICRLVLDPLIKVSSLRPVEQNPSSLKASRFKNGPRKRSRRENKRGTH